MNNNPKSATVAGLLGIFLGAVGAHNWYLGEKKKGIIHLCLLGGAILLMVVTDVILPAAILSSRASLSMAGLILLLNGLAGMVMSGNSLWGLIEGIMILVKGDAGLAARGIPTTGGVGAGMTGTAGVSGQENWQSGAGDATGEVGQAVTSEGAQAGQTAQVVSSSAPAGSVVGVGSVAGAGQMKQPMDPAKKKKIVTGVVIGVAAVVVVVVGAIVVSAVMRVDYGEAYRVAKELKPEVAAVYQNTSCARVADYAASTSVKPADYNKYADDCLAAGGEIDELLKKLGETAGVKRNKEIKAQYDKFSEGINGALPNREELEAKLSLYKAWHEYEYLLKDTEYSSPDSTIQATAAPLINSGNEVLKTYGEGWLASVLTAAQAYRNYNNLPYSSPDKSSARTKYYDAQADHKNWVAANKPDIKQLGGLNFDNNSKMYNEWTKLYDLIRDTYEENYNEGSGDCSALFGEVYCE